MQKSDTINELASALAKAQGEMRSAKKDASNPFFRSQYSTLAACWDCCREPLAKNGLSVVQTVSEDEGERITLHTTLLHASGQWISSTMKGRPTKNDPQGIGSAISYYRRYSLMAIVGIAPDDDDDAEEQTHRKADAPLQPEKNLEKEADDIYISDAQRKRLFAICGENKVTEDILKAYLSKRLIESTKKIRRKEYDQICQAVASGILTTNQVAKEEPMQESPEEVDQTDSWKMVLIPIGKKYKGKRLGVVDLEAQQYYLNDWLPKQDRTKLSPEEKFFAGAVEEMGREWEVKTEVEV